MSALSDFPSTLGVVPDPDAVRRRLAEVVTEAELLRRLLRIAESAVAEQNRLLALPPVDPPWPDRPTIAGIVPGP